MKVILVKPQTYMNLSGTAVRDFLGYFAGGVQESERSEALENLTDKLLVVHDDLDLPPGKLRFRARGSSGGHRGLQSVISRLGHERFSRLRIGVGRAPGEETVNAVGYVLEPLGDSSWEALKNTTAVAADTLPVWIQEGTQACMNRFNAGTPGADAKERQDTGEAGSPSRTASETQEYDGKVKPQQRGASSTADKTDH